MKILDVLRGQILNPPPIWMMRQAGRHLPEYIAMRKSQPDFLAFCLNPRLCETATLQPMERYDPDAAIIFSDILLLHYGLGFRVCYDGDCPSVKKEKRGKQDALCPEKLEPLGEAVERVRSSLPEDKALIGFSSAPWTSLVYALGEKPRPPFIAVRNILGRGRVLWSEIELFTQAAIQHLRLQIKAGVDVVMLFDSWAGILPTQWLEALVFEPHRRIFSTLKKEFPKVPAIGFPHGIPTIKLREYAVKTGVDAVSADDGSPPAAVASQLKGATAVQGNLSPTTLMSGGEDLGLEVEEILKRFKKIPHIFNLGHGVLPATPPQNVEKLFRLLREYH